MCSLDAFTPPQNIVQQQYDPRKKMFLAMSIKKLTKKCQLLSNNERKVMMCLATKKFVIFDFAFMQHMLEVFW